MTTKQTEPEKPARRARRRPDAAMVDQWHELGYVTPEEAADVASVAQSTVYNWIRRKNLPKGKLEGKRTIVRTRYGHIWLLRAAVEGMRTDPAKLAAALEADDEEAA